MSMRTRQLWQAKPDVGSIVIDARGNRYKVLACGSKYARVVPENGGVAGLVPYSSIMPAPKQETVATEITAEEEFES
jgi:hypothetical protein